MNLTQTKRIFLAIGLDTYWQKKVMKLESELAGLNLPDYRIMPSNKLHITIHFWADINLTQISTIIDCTSHICQAFRAFTVALHNIIVFPSEHKPRVIAVKIEQDAMLKALREQLSIEYLEHGVAVEERTYKPHISLARFSKKIPLENPLLKNPFDPEPMYIEQITLFESSVSEQGNIYAPLAKFELQ